VGETTTDHDSDCTFVNWATSFLPERASESTLALHSLQSGALDHRRLLMKAAGDFRDRLLQCLGGEWPKPGPVNAQTVAEEKLDGFRRLKIIYEAEPGDSVPGGELPSGSVNAYLLIPDSASSNNPAPGICVWHQHNGAWHLGASEPAGLAGMPEHHTGVALAREGYVVLCPDALGFGEREKGYKQKAGALERYLFLKYVVEGKCLAWKHILDMRRAVDFLTSRPEVRPDRLGCYGHSMGSTHTWLVGPWEPRLKALCGNCCLPTYKAIHEHEMLHCFPNFIPGLHEFGDTPDVAALIAPRPLHLNFGELDGGSPIEEVRRGVATIQRAYESMHAEDKFTHFIEPNVGHVLSDAMLERVKGFFTKHLKA
jgi:dienelactone hydrolase